MAKSNMSFKNPINSHGVVTMYFTLLKYIERMEHLGCGDEIYDENTKSGISKDWRENPLELKGVKDCFSNNIVNHCIKAGFLRRQKVGHVTTWDGYIVGYIRFVRLTDKGRDYIRLHTRNIIEKMRNTVPPVLPPERITSYLPIQLVKSYAINRATEQFEVDHERLYTPKEWVVYLFNEQNEEIMSKKFTDQDEASTFINMFDNDVIRKGLVRTVIQDPS